MHCAHPRPSDHPCPLDRLQPSLDFCVLRLAVVRVLLSTATRRVGRSRRRTSIRGPALRVWHHGRWKCQPCCGQGAERVPGGAIPVLVRGREGAGGAGMDWCDGISTLRRTIGTSSSLCTPLTVLSSLCCRSGRFMSRGKLSRASSSPLGTPDME